jgi:hypothetical protein
VAGSVLAVTGGGMIVGGALLGHGLTSDPNVLNNDPSARQVVGEAGIILGVALGAISAVLLGDAISWLRAHPRQ